ncbi:MAG: GDSL family lipase, partial [Vallitaleaceae bacterium]|nr:GDSL family lipase [Vallitaleaceae bacterium]
KVGDEETKKFFMNFGPHQYDNYLEGLEDNTHLRYDGAVLFARMIAEGLRDLGGVYKQLLLDADRL